MGVMSGQRGWVLQEHRIIGANPSTWATRCPWESSHEHRQGFGLATEEDECMGGVSRGTSRGGVDGG